MKRLSTLSLVLFFTSSIWAATKTYTVLSSDTQSALNAIMTSNIGTYKDYVFIFDSQTTYSTVYSGFVVPATVTSITFRSNSSNGTMPTVYFYGITFNDALCTNLTFDGLNLISTAATKYIVAVETASKYPKNITIQNCDIGCAANASVTPNRSPYSAAVRFRNANTYAFGNVNITNSIFRNMGTAAVSNESTTTGTLEGISITNCSFIECNQGLSYQPNLLNIAGSSTPITVSNCTYYNNTVTPANFNRLPTTITNISFDKLLFAWGGTVPATLKVFYGSTALSLSSSYITKTTDITLTNSGSPAVSEYNGLATALMSGSASGNYIITDANFTGKASVGDPRWYYPSSITLGSSSLTGFSYNSGSGPSTEKTFTISASALRSVITLTAPSDYEISSTSGSGFTNSLILGSIGSDLSTTTIYVRLKAGLAVANYNLENISVAATSVTTQNVSCSGTVVSSTPTLTVPTNVSTTSRATTSFDISWGAVANASSYTAKIYQNGNEIINSRQTGISGTTTSFSGLSSGTSYTYTVTAIGDNISYASSAESTPTSVTTISTAKAITVFTVTGQTSSTINESAKTIIVYVPQGTSLSSIAPSTMTVSSNASVLPAQGTSVDFSNSSTTPITYTVTAEDGSTQDYAVTVAGGSLATDYYRSKASGDWNDATPGNVWESSSDNNNWYTATVAPGTSAASITIKSPNTVTVSANTSIGTTTIESGATLKTTGTAVVTLGTSKTLTVNGTFENNGTVSDLIFTGATAVNFNSGSTYLLSGANLFIPGGTSIINWNSNSTVNVTGGIAGAWATTAGTVYGNIIFNSSTITGSAVIFNAGSPMQRVAGNFTVSNLGTNGVIQLISSSNTNILAIDGDYLQSSGTVLLNPSSQAATTFRPVVVKGNFTLDGGTFTISSNTANCYLIVEGDFAINNTAILQNTGATNASGAAYIHLAGANTTFTRSASSSITATTGNMINFVVNPGCILDMGNNTIDGSSNVNFILNGFYTAPTIVGSTTSTTTSQANHLLTITSGSISGIQPGMAISGGSIPTNTYVTAVYSPTQLQISKGTTATATGVAFTITPASAHAGTLKTSHINGLNGNIQVSGAKTLSSVANYEFYGSSSGQVTGSTMPTSVNNLTINNTNGITLSQATTIAGTLTLTSGSLSPATNLTLGSSANIVKTGGSLDAAPTFASSLTGITYSGSSSVTVGNEFPASAAITSLTINNTGGVTLANSLTSATNLTIGSGASLTLPAGKQLTISGTLSNSGTINLSSDANGTATILTPSGSAGTASVQQYLPQGRNWYISSPVASADATSISGANLGGSVVFYDEANSNWAPVTGTLTPGIGYISVASAGTATSNAVFNGTLNNGDIPVTLSRKGATKAGFNLIANPYPSYLDGMAAVSSNANLEQTIWYRTKISGVYYFETVNTTSGVGSSPVEGSSVSRLIPPMQAFWIRTLTDNNTLTFTNAMRYHANPTISGSTITTTTMKAPKALNNIMIRLKVSNGINSDETVIYSNENASSGYDIYDSQKMMNNSTTIPDLYSIIDNNSLVINGMNSLSTDTEIPLGFAPGSAGAFSIKASELSNLNADLDVYLKDSHDNSYNKLVQGDSYSFSSDNTATTSRFSVVLKSKSTTTDITNKKANDNVKIYANTNSQLVINCPEAMVGKAKLSIINAIGQIVNQQTITKSNMQINLPAGLYTINAGTMTSKVIIK